MNMYTCLWYHKSTQDAQVLFEAPNFNIGIISINSVVKTVSEIGSKKLIYLYRKKKIKILFGHKRIASNTPHGNHSCVLQA